MSSDVFFFNGTFPEAASPHHNKQMKTKKKTWIRTQFQAGYVEWIRDLANCIILSLPQEGLRTEFDVWWSLQNSLVLFLALEETMKTWAQRETFYWPGDILKPVHRILESQMQKTEGKSVYQFIWFDKA